MCVVLKTTTSFGLDLSAVTHMNNVQCEDKISEDHLL